jgi:transposase
MVRIGPLSEEQRQALERLRRRAVGRVSQRAHIVLLSARGYSVPQIASIFDVGEEVVRTWLHRYQQTGPAGLQDRLRPGRPPKDRLARQLVDTPASNPPCHSGLVQTCWTVGLLAALVLARCRVALAPSSVRRYRHASDGRWARPRLAPATHAPGGQRKNDPEAAGQLGRIATALATAATVLYMDECELQLLPGGRAMGMKGPRVRVPTPGQNAKRAGFGALNAHTGALHTLIQERKRAVDCVAFLDRLVQAYPSGEVVLILDNVRRHDAKVVRAWLAQPAHRRFRLLWLPKYSAHEHNPIERVWGLLKAQVAANRLHGRIEALVAAAERYLAETQFRAPSPPVDTASTEPAQAA